MSARNDTRVFDEFLQWEQATHDTIDFKRVYAYMAEDVVAGLMLSQIVFWHLPNSRTGKTKLRVRKEGQLWLVVSMAAWWDICYLTPNQARRALGKLRERGLIETKVWKFDGAPTTHIRIVKGRFNELWQQCIQNPPTNPYAPSDSSGDEEGSSVNCADEQMDLTPGTNGFVLEHKSITETPTETPTESRIINSH